MSLFQIHYSGDNALLLQFKPEISEENNAYVMTCKQLITQATLEQNITGILEIVPSYCALLLYYNPLLISPMRLCNFLETLTLPKHHTHQKQRQIFKIPICYEEPFSLDLDYVAEHAGISPQEVITLHSSPLYLVYMLGFVAGFPYLGGLNSKIATPRLKQPRTKIEAGSVGIADQQTGIYPIDSPGGWQIIGKTPLKLFDAFKENPVLLKAGIYLKFDPITLSAFHDIQQALIHNTYIFKEEQ